MVILRKRSRGNDGVFMIEGMVGIAILVIAVFPLAMWSVLDAKALHKTYQRAVASEMVDGEMEILAAGGWRGVVEGTNEYHASGKAGANLPEGKFQVIRRGDHVWLEWKALRKSGIGAVAREAVIK
jgi:hypothetical protein